MGGETGVREERRSEERKGGYSVIVEEKYGEKRTEGTCWRRDAEEDQ